MLAQQKIFILFFFFFVILYLQFFGFFIVFFFFFGVGIIRQIIEASMIGFRWQYKPILLNIKIMVYIREQFHSKGEMQKSNKQKKHNT